MSPLPNARHERFAQEVAKGSTSDEAYRLAGFKPNRSNASRLTAKDNIKGRIMELKGEAADRAVVTVETLIQYAEEARQLAMKTDQPSAAIAAVKEMGVLTGLRVIRTENTHENHNYDTSAEPLSEEEWSMQFARH